MSRCDSAAIVSKTSELFPLPETPVNTVVSRVSLIQGFGRWASDRRSQRRAALRTWLTREEALKHLASP